jgi:hypothetical protein
VAPALVILVAALGAATASAAALERDGERAAARAAVAKLEQRWPGHLWRVTHVQFVAVPYTERDSRGVLLEVSKQTPCFGGVGPPCPPPPEWVVELAGLNAYGIVCVGVRDGLVDDWLVTTSPGATRPLLM